MWSNRSRRIYSHAVNFRAQDVLCSKRVKRFFLHVEGTFLFIYKLINVELILLKIMQ